MDIPNRKLNRLKNYDYSQAGGYYITICTNERRHQLSEVICVGQNEKPQIRLTELGEVAQHVLMQMAEQDGCHADAWIIMPDHIHIILIIDHPSKQTIGRYIGAYKSIVSNQWQKICDSRGVQMGKIWQRNYYDHILRNEIDYMEKLRYMENNPIRWIEKHR